MKERIQKAYDTGYPIFEQLYNMSHVEIREKLNSILKSQAGYETYQSVISAGTVVKESYDDKPHEIKINFYDTIEINFMGIAYKGEHRAPRIIVAFDEHFKL